MKNCFYILTALAFLADTGLAAQKPNVVIICGDDVGFGDVGVYGSKMIPTPNIDAQELAYASECAGSSGTESGVRSGYG